MLTQQGKILYLNGGDTEPVKIVGFSAAPNETGTTNRIGSLEACSFEVATDDERVLSEAVQVEVDSPTNVTHWGVFNTSDVMLHLHELETPRTGLIAGDVIVFRPDGPDPIRITIE